MSRNFLIRLLFGCSVALVAFCWHYRAHAETVVSADVLADTAWTKEGSPYVIDIPVTIEIGVTLSVEAGARVILSGPESRLRVLGTLSAQGSAGNEIHIESDGPYAPGITTFGGSIHMRHTIVSGLSSIDSFEGGTVSLRHANVIGARVGIYGSSLEAADSAFLDAKSSAIMVFAESGTSSSAVIRGSTISGSRSYGLYVDVGAVVDARHNFWGDPSGPKSAEYNPLGKGVRTYGAFDLKPWLSIDPFACCSSVMFLPGLEASRLYVDETVPDLPASILFGENGLWEPNRDKDIQSLGLTVTGASTRAVYTKLGDAIDEAYVSLAGPNIYKSFMGDMNDLVATGTVREWLPAAYDWRLSLDQLLGKGSVSSSGALSYLESSSTPYVIQEFYRLAQNSKTGRVSIVAHSHGGLLAKALALYVEGRGDGDLIDKVVFVAVPQTGTPHAIGALLHGFREGIPLLASAQAMRRLGQNMPSAYNLLPSARYLAFDSRPLITFSTSTTAASTSSPLVEMRSAYGSAIRSFATLLDFLRGSERTQRPAYADLSLPETLNQRLLARASSAHESLDAWTPSPSSELFEIAGKGLDTVSGIEYYEGKKGKKPALLYRPMFSSDGDGTVMTQSAWSIPAGLNVYQYWVDLSRANQGIAVDHNHASILEVPDLRAFIREVLSESPHPIRHRARVASATVPTSVRTQKVTRVSVHSSAISVRAVDSAGNHTGVSRSSGLPETSIPGSQYGEFGDVTYVSVPEGRVTVSVDTHSPAFDDSGVDVSSVTIDVDDVEGDTVIATSSYSDITVSTSTVITIDVTASLSSDASTTVPVPATLRVDDDGDGSIDREVVRDVPVIVSEVAVTDDSLSDTVASSAAPVDVPRTRIGGRRHLPEIIETAAPVEVVVSDDIVPRSPMALARPIHVQSAILNVGMSAARATRTPPVAIIASDAITSVGVFATDNLASAYLADRGYVGLSLILLLFLVLAILLFLSCKISKSR